MSTAPADLIEQATQWWSTEIIDLKPGVIRFRGYPIEQLIGAVSFPQMIWLMLRGEMPSAAQAELLEAALVSAVDHGPQAPSIATGRMAVTCGLPLNGAMASAIDVLDDIHGGAGEQCMELYADIDRRMQEGTGLDRAVGEGLDAFIAARGKIISGFGNRFHPVDPRSPRLLALVDEARMKGTVAGRFANIGRGVEAAQGPPHPDEHRRRHGRHLLGAGFLRAARPRPVHPVTLSRHPGARLGAVAAGRPDQGTYAAEHCIRLFGRPRANLRHARSTSAGSRVRDKLHDLQAA